MGYLTEGCILSKSPLKARKRVTYYRKTLEDIQKAPHFGLSLWCG